MYIFSEDLLRAFYKLFCLRFCISSDVWKNIVWQRLYKRIWERCLYENNRNYNPYKFSYKSTFISFLFCQEKKQTKRNKKQKSNFQQFGGLVTRNYFSFCLQRVAFYFKGVPKSIEFYKRILLHVVPARTITLC